MHAFRPDAGAGFAASLGCGRKTGQRGKRPDLWTLLLLVWTVVLLCTVKWYWALAALALLIPAPMLSYDWFEQVRRCFSSWRYLLNGRIRSLKNDLMNNLDTI